MASRKRLLERRSAISTAEADQRYGKRQAEAPRAPRRATTQALYIGLNHPDRFGWVVSMSGALIMYAGRFDELFPDVSAASLERVRLVSMTTGTEDFLLAINRRFSEWLRARGVAVSYEETPGAHTWGVWRRALARIAPLLFRPAD